MMFALRGTAVSLAFFVLMYCFLSALVSACWRLIRHLKSGEENRAPLLFVLRVLPLLTSVVLTFVFVVPSFQLLEPRSTEEGVGALPITLGIAALFLVVCGGCRAIVAQARAWRIAAQWMHGARPLYNGSGAIALRTVHHTPPITLVGTYKPRILVSGSALEALTADEFHIALRHEISHIRSRDNLKKLVFRLSPFPGMTELEIAWAEAAELAADDAAVSDVKEAVDLAAALVKISRLGPVDANPACTVGFASGSLRVRVARLLAWDESRLSYRRTLRWTLLPAISVVITCLCVAYAPALSLTHEVTEWLVN